MRSFALAIFIIDPIITDQRVSHRDDLAPVARVGQDLLITGHGGIKTDLSIHLTLGTERVSLKDGSVLKGEFRRLAL